VVDFRSIPVMKALGYPVIVDCTHSLQKPNTGEGITGGLPEYIEMMVRTAIAAGADGIFIETHPDPRRALSDGANMLPLDKMKKLLEKAKNIHKAL
jgi:2-dehydro-3-deoxyphosphooctonate aldolase (KDO 8-P synthase)